MLKRPSYREKERTVMPGMPLAIEQPSPSYMSASAVAGRHHSSSSAGGDIEGGSGEGAITRYTGECWLCWQRRDMFMVELKNSLSRRINTGHTSVLGQAFLFPDAGHVLFCRQARATRLTVSSALPTRLNEAALNTVTPRPQHRRNTPLPTPAQPLYHNRHESHVLCPSNASKVKGKCQQPTVGGGKGRRGRHGP